MLGETAAEHHAATVSFGRFEANQSVQQANYEDISSVDADLIWKMIKVCSFLLQQKMFCFKIFTTKRSRRAQFSTNGNPFSVNSSSCSLSGIAFFASHIFFTVT